MMIANDLYIDDSGYAPAASCAVCGNDIAAGAGVTARYQGRLLRFKCRGCLSRFAADPDRYLEGGPAGCCGKHVSDATVTEWSVD